MLLRTRLTVFVVAAMVLTMMVAAPAFAHQCANVSKQSGAGSIGTYNVATDEFAENGKAGGGFVTVTDGSTFSYDVFAHKTLPDGARAAGPGGESQCDGVGIDDAMACEGVAE
jgi:hypothetical protein